MELGFKVSKEAKIRNQCTEVPYLTQDTTPESDKNTIKHHTQESQEVSPFPAGDHKAAMNRQESITNTKHKLNKNDPQKKHLLGKVSKNIILEGFS